MVKSVDDNSIEKRKGIDILICAASRVLQNRNRSKDMYRAFNRAFNLDRLKSHFPSILIPYYFYYPYYVRSIYQ